MSSLSIGVLLGLHPPISRAANDPDGLPALHPTDALSAVAHPAGLTPLRWNQRGVASHYGNEFNGRRTASGAHFDPLALTAAHRTLPFGTRVRVRNLQNGRSVVVRINDRGPWTGSRVIDLSQAAAQAIGLRGLGTVAIDMAQRDDTAAIR